MLLYIQGSFFQVLEGDKVAVSRIFEDICHDVRHTRAVQIIREPIAQRSFAEWTMGFTSLEFREIGGLIGENDFFADASCLEKLASGRAKKLLQAFQSGSWRSDETGVFDQRGRVA